MKFVADSMLGRLASWLRIIGCDTEYCRKIEDRDLLRLADEQGRIILTKDTLLVKRKQAKKNSFFIASDLYKDQLKEVVSAFSIDPFSAVLTRCILCNAALEKIEKKSAEHRVPEYVLQTQTCFLTCPSCGRIYWAATHRDSIFKTLREIFY